MIPLLWTTAAWAAPTSVTVCVRYETDFADALASAGDDLWRYNNVPKKARGIRFAINDSQLWSSNPVEFDDYADHEGCADMTLESTDAPFYIRITSEYEFDGGATLAVASGITTYNVYGTNGFTPVSGNTYTYTLDGSAVDLKWVNVGAAAAYTFHRLNDAYYPADYEIQMDEHPTEGGSAFDNQSGVVYIDPATNGHRWKYIIAHEMGHALLQYAMWGGSGALGGYAARGDYDRPVDGDCPGGAGHQHNSKEYQSAAIIEGHAQYVAARTFNYATADADCRYVPHYWVQWDPDSAVSADPGAFSCEGSDEGDTGGAEFVVFGVDGFDYYGDHCTGTDNTDTATDLDWLRFFWDADTDDASTPFDIEDSLAVLDYARPWDWRIPTGGTVDALTAVQGAFTYFDSGTFAQVWTDWSTVNGVDR